MPLQIEPGSSAPGKRRGSRKASKMRKVDTSASQRHEGALTRMKDNEVDGALGRKDTRRRGASTKRVAMKARRRVKERKTINRDDSDEEEFPPPKGDNFAQQIDKQKGRILTTAYSDRLLRVLTMLRGICGPCEGLVCRR